MSMCLLSITVQVMEYAERILVEGNRATGVLLQDGSRRRAEVIVANADLPYVYTHLLPDEHEAHHLERMKYTSSALMFSWGVDTLCSQLGIHNVFLSGNYQGSFERIFKDHTLVNAIIRVDEPQLPTNRLPAPTQPAPPLPQSLLCR